MQCELEVWARFPESFYEPLLWDSEEFPTSRSLTETRTMCVFSVLRTNMLSEAIDYRPKATFLIDGQIARFQSACEANHLDEKHIEYAIWILMLVSDIAIRSVHVIEMSQFKTPYNEHYMFWAVPSKNSDLSCRAYCRSMLLHSGQDNCSNMPYTSENGDSHKQLVLFIVSYFM